MQHGTRSAAKASGTKKLFAGIAALGVAAGAYGVYATTLDVSGSTGTQLQAGTDTSMAVNGVSCLSGTSVSENYVTSDAPYVTTRPSFQVAGTASTAYTSGTLQFKSACDALVVTLAVKLDADYNDSTDEIYVAQTDTATVAEILANGGHAIDSNSDLKGSASQAVEPASAFSVKVAPAA